MRLTSMEAPVHLRMYTEHRVSPGGGGARGFHILVFLNMMLFFLKKEKPDAKLSFPPVAMLSTLACCYGVATCTVTVPNAC